jgi:carboxyl-terminal processing protease
VQVSNQLHDDGGVVKLTIARWLTPSGRNVHGAGLTPDVAVTLTEDDRLAGRDPQLSAALERLLAGG